MSSRKPFRKKKKTLIEKLDMNMTTKDYMQWKKKFLIKSDPGKKIHYWILSLLSNVQGKKCIPMEKKIIKGEWKIKRVIENWPRNYIWLTGFMMKILFNKIWPNLLTFQLKRKRCVQTPAGAKGGVLMAVKCQRTCVLCGLLRWYSCWMVLKCVFVCPPCLMLAHELVEVGFNYIGWLNLEVNT